MRRRAAIYAGRARFGGAATTPEGDDATLGILGESAPDRTAARTAAPHRAIERPRAS